MSAFLTVATRAIKKGGVELEKRFARFNRRDVQYKKANEMVTVADRAVEKIIIREIRKEFPKHSIVSEEAGLVPNDSEYRWTVDPIDGTSNFIMGNPLFGISVALLRGHDVVLGVNYFPLLKRLYTAEFGKGARLNGKKIKVSAVSSYNRGIHAFCHGQTSANIHKMLRTYKQLLPQHMHLRHFGSAAFEMSMVADGSIDTYISIGNKLWDVTAGICLVTEAGGKITDAEGNPWTPGSSITVATNGQLHRTQLQRWSA